MKDERCADSLDFLDISHLVGYTIKRSFSKQVKHLLRGICVSAH